MAANTGVVSITENGSRHYSATTQTPDTYIGQETSNWPLETIKPRVENHERRIRQQAQAIIENQTTKTGGKRKLI